jgi:hypothetical protein
MPQALRVWVGVMKRSALLVLVAVLAGGVVGFIGAGIGRNDDPPEPVSVERPTTTTEPTTTTVRRTTTTGNHDYNPSTTDTPTTTVVGCAPNPYLNGGRVCGGPPRTGTSSNKVCAFSKYVSGCYDRDDSIWDLAENLEAEDRRQQTEEYLEDLERERDTSWMGGDGSTYP